MSQACEYFYAYFTGWLYGVLTASVLIIATILVVVWITTRKGREE